MRRLTALVLAAPLLAGLAVPLSAAADSYPAPGVCPVSGPAVCFTAESHTPTVTVPAKGTSEGTYARFTAAVHNGAASTVTHFTITAAPDAQAFTVLSLTGSAQGTAASCAKLVCSFGNLRSGADASIDLQVKTIAGTTALQAANTFTLSFDERANDTPTNGGKGDTVSAPAQTVSLRKHDGSSVVTYLPAGLPSGTVLTTDRAGTPFATATTTETEVATTEVPANLPQSTTASVTRPSEAQAGACLTGATCFMPDWVQVSLPVELPSGFLRTTVRVDGSVLPAGTDPTKVPVYYKHLVDGELGQLPACVLDRSGTPLSVGCVVTSRGSGGDVIATVYEDQNGFIRL